MKKILFLIILGVALYFGVRYLSHKPEGNGSASSPQEIEWGLNFSPNFSRDLGYDPQELYLRILDDLKPLYLRLPIYWQNVEKEKDKFDFSEYDFYVSEAKKRNIRLTLAVGRKLPRWPECHEPDWVKKISQEESNKELLDYIETSVLKYKDDLALEAWQVENEPFLPFGTCPKADSALLEKEISLVRSLDTHHPILITDSGEIGTWFQAIKNADIFGTTMYRVIWNKYLGYFKYPLPPQFFWVKTNLIKLIYKDTPIIVSELQAEPWGPKLIFETPLEDQMKSMSIEQLRDNISYAKKVGFSKNYLWGTEWWYYILDKYNKPEFLEEIKMTLR